MNPNLEKGLAFLIGMVTVILLAKVIGWASQCRRQRKAKDLLDAYPKCKHGARVFGVKCDKCYRETEAFFADKPSAPDMSATPGPFRAPSKETQAMIDELAKYRSAPLFAPNAASIATQRYFKFSTEAMVYLESACKFKVGQYVRWISDAVGVPVGTLCRITHMTGADHYQMVPAETGYGPYHGGGKYLEAATPKRGEWWTWTGHPCLTCSPAYPGRAFQWEASDTITVEEQRAYVQRGCLAPVDFRRGT